MSQVINYGNINAAGVRTPTARNEVFVANKRNVANITHIYIDDGGVFDPVNYIHFASWTMLPAAPAVNDALYFGIQTSLTDSGPFDSLVFDIGTAAIYGGAAAISWEYWDGAAWFALSVQDNTDGGTGPFSVLGVVSVHWTHPSNWATTAVNGVTGYWVRATVSVLGGGDTLTAPIHQTRHVYSIVWPYVEIQNTEIEGDLDAISNHSFRLVSRLNTISQRVIAGTREVSRGADFIPVINMAQDQNPSGVTVTPLAGPAAFLTDIDGAPAGEVIQEALWAGAERLNITIAFDDTLANHYIGRFRAFLRASLPTFGAAGNAEFTLRWSVGTHGETIINETALIAGSGGGPLASQLADLGIVDVIVPAGETLDELKFEIYSRNPQTTTDVIDFWLMPVDERGLEVRIGSTVNTSDGTIFADNITNPKRFVSYAVEGGQFLTNYSTVGQSLSQLPPRIRYRVYFLEHSSPDAQGNITAQWFQKSAKIMLETTQRYLSLRGDR